MGVLCVPCTLEVYLQDTIQIFGLDHIAPRCAPLDALSGINLNSARHRRQEPYNIQRTAAVSSQLQILQALLLADKLPELLAQTER